MDDGACAAALGVLIAGTNGWDGDAADLYHSQLRALGSADALRRACESIVRGWSEGWRPPLEVVLASYDREVALGGTSPARALPGGRVHCDGSGWVRDAVLPDRMTPCPRCSPALAEVFADPEKFERWKHGASMESLDVGVELVGGRFRYKSGARPPRCFAAEDPAEDVPPLGAGREIAWHAYAEERRAAGKRPTRKHFDRMTRGGK